MQVLFHLFCFTLSFLFGFDFNLVLYTHHCDLFLPFRSCFPYHILVFTLPVPFPFDLDTCYHLVVLLFLLRFMDIFSGGEDATIREGGTWSIGLRPLLHHHVTSRDFHT